MRRIFPETSPYLNDPDGWAREKLRLESWSKPREIRESVRDHRKTAVPSCHSAAKTHTAASIAGWWIDTHPPGEAFVVSTAPVHYQVQSLLWAEISSMHSRGSLQGRLTGLTGTSIPEWYIAGSRVGFGRKTADEPDPAKAMQAFQGKHARYILVIIDEAGGVDKWLYDAIDSIASNEHARVLAIGNPDDPASHFAEVCGPDSGWNVIPISAFDTPLYTGEPVSEQLLEMLISAYYVEEMGRLGVDSHLYQSKVLGQFPDVSDDTLFPPRILAKAFDREKLGLPDLPGLARGGYGVDVARKGDAETVVYRNRAGVLELVKAWSKKDTEETADLVDDILSASLAPTFVDAVGVGAGVYDKLRRRQQPVIDFNGGERAFEPDRFVNRRAETFWTLRQRMDDGDVQCDPDDVELRSQLGRIKWKQVSGGRVQIESKDDMAKRGVKSPDRADAAAMAYAAPVGIDLRPAVPPPAPIQIDIERKDLW